MIPPAHNAVFVAAMEDILAVYARPVDLARPLVCFDERGKDLKAQTRSPHPAQPGRIACEDAEHARQGSVNGFLAIAPHRGWRQVTVTERRAAIDFAQALRALVDVHCPQAERIVLVADNLNTHRPAALYQTFPPAEAWRILERIEWRYPPHSRVLAQHRRTRIVGLAAPMLGAPHPRSGDPRPSNGRLGGRAQRRPRRRRLALLPSRRASAAVLALPPS
ncbi:MAG TPA: transposase [Thermomicrobiales bacterium]|nr:transposase [Thermomicrobiales bacterium]